MLNQFLLDYCPTNNVITTERAGGKKQSWECTDQLLINKMILEEVQHQRRNLLMMWFDYEKAFDSMPHDRTIQALQPEKIPVKIINAIKNLMYLWPTKVHLLANQYNLESDKIHYHTGVLQVDCLSLILFILSVNPLSFLLNTLNGYRLGKPDSKRRNISHLFFVDNLKSYAQNISEAKQQLDLITTLISGVGIDKCSYTP